MTSSKKPAKPIRLTIAISPEVHAAYKAMGATAGMSLSRTIAEWLADTLDGCKLVTQQMAEAKAAPQRVLNHLLAANRGTHDLILKAKDEVRRRDA